MDKKIAGVIAAIGAIAPLGVAQAAAPSSEIEQVMRASSFSELLQPIPNAAALLKSANEKTIDEAQADAPVGDLVAQYHHHHHHHHHWWRRRYHHHHHHHHHHYE
jgi:hypothetical protein